MADKHPVLLRPPVWLVTALDELAEEEGSSRHAWILCALTDAVQVHGYREPLEDPAGPSLTIVR